MNKTTALGFLWITFPPFKGISFQLGKTGWNYYNQEEKYKRLFSFSLVFSFEV
jgi:hypothetical protein